MSQEERKHSSLPWTLEESEILQQVESGLFKAVPIHTRRIAGTLNPCSDDWDEAEANAKLIETAVNSFYPMREALENLLALIQHETDLPKSATNGITDPSGQIDQGVYYASKFIDEAQQSLNLARKGENLENKE